MGAIIDHLVKAIGWSIIHSLWQGAIIYTVLFILLAIGYKNSARAKHNLSFAALVLMFIGFCITFFSLFELPSNGSLINSVAIKAVAGQGLSRFSNNYYFKDEVYIPIIVLIYSLGILFQTVILLSSYQKLKRIKKENILAIPAEWKSIFDFAMHQLKISKTVKFYLSTKVNVPLVIGFFKPVVLFPIVLATQLDHKQVEAILIHELSHIRRNDYLTNLLKSGIETLLFFNPFVWLTTKLLAIEREHACDDLVVSFTGRPVNYAQTLLKLELLKNKQSPALSLAATGNKQHLYQRIKRITDMKTNYSTTKQQFYILALSVSIIVSLAWINPSKNEIVKTKKATAITMIKSNLADARTLLERPFLKVDTDSVQKKTNKFHMVITDKDGQKVTYYSVDELPDSLKLKYKAMEEKFDSPEWKDKMAAIQKNSEELEKKFNSPEWKEKMAAIQKNSEELEKKFNSPEWKDKMAAIQKSSEELEKKFNSPEWKDKMAAIQKGSEEMQKKLNSPEWKAKMEDLKKLQELPEFKELMKKQQKELQELKKANGIKIDIL
ncbi:MAG: M56 family metallopeptidase [Pelobium sp.]